VTTYKKENDYEEKSLILLSLVLILALAFAGTALAQKAKKPYDLVQWNKPKPIGQRISGPQYVLPDGWKEAVKGVTKIKCRTSALWSMIQRPSRMPRSSRSSPASKLNFSPGLNPRLCQNDLYLCSQKPGRRRFLLRPSHHLHADGAGGWLHPIDAIWDDPGCLEALCPSHQERPDGSRRQDLRVHRPGEDHDALLSALHCLEGALHVGRVTGDGEESHYRQGLGLHFRRRRRDGYHLSSPGHDLLQGGRMVDVKRQRIVINTPEGKNAGRCSPTWCSPTECTHLCSRVFMDECLRHVCYGQGRHGHDSHCGCQPVQGSKKAPNIQNDWEWLLRPNGMHPSQTSITRPIMTSTVT